MGLKLLFMKYQDLFTLKNKSPFFLIAGPCAIENKEIPHEVAATLKVICQELDIPLIFKGSYRKANRSSIHSFTGIGDEAALKILSGVASNFDLPVTTDIHTDEDAEMAAEYVDVLQIPAFLCRQTSLIQAAAKTGKMVSIKKGQFMSPGSMGHAVTKVRDSGNDQVILIERGTTFGYQDLVVDYRGIPEMQSFDVPVIMDCTHALQQPNQSSGITGGRPGLISTIARAAIAVGVDGLFIETHPDPSSAKSDGANMLPLSEIRGLLEQLLRISEAVRE